MSISRWFEEQYHEHPIIHGLIQLVPLGIGAGLDAAVNEQLQKMYRARLATMFRELRDGERELTPELIQSEDFLQAYFATVAAVLRAKRHEKIRFHARLLLATTGPNPVINLPTEHEEFLSILDDLSYREIGILATLAAFERATPKHGDENDANWSDRYWKDFSQTTCEKFAIAPVEFAALLGRLSRSGCYETYAGVFVDYTPGQGKLTRSYYRLAEAINVQGLFFAP